MHLRILAGGRYGTALRTGLCFQQPGSQLVMYEK